MNRLKGEVALITGGASGLGKAQAIKFASEGATVILADISQEKLDSVVDEITKDGGVTIGIKTDVTNNEEIDYLVNESLKQFGKISILSNTAGMFDHYLPLLKTSEESWDKIISLNITSIYKLTSKVLPAMLENGKGVVINITSGAGLIGGGGGMGYTSTKHAVVGFTKQLNAEYGLQGIRSNAIAPGLIETPMVQDLIDDPNSGISQTLKKIPAGRYGKAEEIADLAVFLASDESKYIYGAVVPIDGGLLSTLR